MLPGEVAFKLYDTYGFPLDLTEDVLRDDSIDVDVAGFNRLMDEQKERGRAARKGLIAAHRRSVIGCGTASRFVGYHQLRGRVRSARAPAARTSEHVAVDRRGDALLSRGRRAGRRPRRDRDRVRRDSRSVGHAQGRRLDRSRRAGFSAARPATSHAARASSSRSIESGATPRCSIIPRRTSCITRCATSWAIPCIRRARSSIPTSCASTSRIRDRSRTTRWRRSRKRSTRASARTPK